MADLSAANVTFLDSWKTGNTNGKRNTVRRVKWTNTTAGGTSNKLLASAFGITKILKCDNILLDSGHVYPAVPSADGSYIVATDGTSATPADVATSTNHAYCTIEGV